MEETGFKEYVSELDFHLHKLNINDENMGIQLTEVITIRNRSLCCGISYKYLYLISEFWQKKSIFITALTRGRQNLLGLILWLRSS